MKSIFWCVAVLFIAMGCVDDDNSEGIAVREKRLAEISAEVEAVIANKSCNGADDCASIAWGSKPCGGPWGYLVYAPSNVEVSRLESLVAEYNSLESELNQLRGSASDCALVEQPELECTDNVCVAM